MSYGQDKAGGLFHAPNGPQSPPDTPQKPRGHAPKTTRASAPLNFPSTFQQNGVKKLPPKNRMPGPISCFSGTMDGYAIDARTDAFLAPLPSWIDRATCSVWEDKKKTKPTAPNKKLTFKCYCGVTQAPVKWNGADDPSAIGEKKRRTITGGVTNS